MVEFIVNFWAHLGVDLGQFGLALQQPQHLEPGEIVAPWVIGEYPPKQFQVLRRVHCQSDFSIVRFMIDEQNAEAFLMVIEDRA